MHDTDSSFASRSVTQILDYDSDDVEVHLNFINRLLNLK